MEETLARIKMKKCAQPFQQGWDDRACEIDLPIESHQQLNCLDARVICANLLRFEDVFVGQVLDRVAEDLERTTGFWSDMAATIAICNGDRLSWRASVNGNSSCGCCHGLCTSRSSKQRALISSSAPSLKT